MKKTQLINLIKSNRITEASIVTNAKSETLKLAKVGYNKITNNIYFVVGTDCIIPSIYKKDIYEIHLSSSQISEYKYSLNISLENDDVYCLHFNMEAGYNPYLVKKHESENYQLVSETVVNKLAEYKGKTVNVRFTQISQMFEEYFDDDCSYGHPITFNTQFKELAIEKFIEREVPCLRIYDKTNSGTSIKIMGIFLVSNGILFTQDGDFYLEIAQ